MSDEDDLEVSPWPRALDGRSSIASGILLTTGAVVVLASLALPWSRAASASGHVASWTPEGTFRPSTVTTALIFAAVLTLVFGLNRLRVFRLWRWLRVSALWPFLALWYLTGLLASEAVNTLSASGSSVSYSVSNSVGPYVAGIGGILITLAAVIEGQSRRRQRSRTNARATLDRHL